MGDMEKWFDILLIVLELLYELTVDYYIGLNSVSPLQIHVYFETVNVTFL